MISLKDSPTEIFFDRGVSIASQFNKVEKELKGNRKERREEAKKVGKERGSHLSDIDVYI